MLIAQALGEYGALSGFAESFNNMTIDLENTVGSWGVEGLVALIAGAILWKFFSGRQRLK
jgi:hypothetical protein